MIVADVTWSCLSIFDLSISFNLIIWLSSNNHQYSGIPLSWFYVLHRDYDLSPALGGQLPDMCVQNAGLLQTAA